MTISPELLAALEVTERPELLLSLDEDTRGEFFSWCLAKHPEYLEPVPVWELVRRHVVRTGEIPPGVKVGEPNIEGDKWFLKETEPTVTTKEVEK
jgi:hypothetical protein